MYSAIERTPLDFWTEKFGNLKDWLQLNGWINSQGDIDIYVDEEERVRACGGRR